MLTAEVPAAALDRDAVGRTLARLVAICDLLYEESASFLGDWVQVSRNAPTSLLERYAADVAELEAPDAEPRSPTTVQAEPRSPTPAGSAGEPAP
jgi:hypothetical protein